MIRQKTFNRTTTALAASLVASASPALLCGVSGRNTSSSLQYIQVFDSATLPSNGTVPVISVDALPSKSFAFDFGANPREFTNGIIVCNSSTADTKTIGSADCLFDVQMKKVEN